MGSSICSAPSRHSRPRIHASILAPLLALAMGLTAIPVTQATARDRVAGSIHTITTPRVNQATAANAPQSTPHVDRTKMTRNYMVMRNALQRPGHGEFALRTRDGKTLRVFSYRPPGFDPRQGRIWFVLHGAERDAEHYAHLAAASADVYDTLVIALEFSSDLFPTSEHYSLGITSSGNPDWRAYAEGRLLEPQDYVFNEIERAFDTVRDALGGTQDGYYLFGHSAGAQFVHRMMTFAPWARINGAVAANAGWYTLPFEDSRSGMRLPYSLYGLPSGAVDQRALFAAPLTILLGSEDTGLAIDNPNLRSNLGAMEQGPHRLARGLNYYLVAWEVAEDLGVPFRWNLQEVPDVGHNPHLMIPPAAHILFEQAFSGN